MSQTTPLEPTSPSAAAGLGKPAPGQSREQLRALAAQFESMLMAQMMRSMRTSMFDDGKDTGFADGPLSDALYGELSLALSRAGGFGLGDAVMGPLARQAHQQRTASVPAAAPIQVPAAAFVASPGQASDAVAVEPAAPVVDKQETVAPAAIESARPSVPVAAPRATDGRVSSAFGWRKDPIDGTSKFHKGMDIAMPVGTEVASARDGEVAFAGEVPGYGLTVLVNHAGQITTRYAHLSEIHVVPGQVVSEGQVIALSGATGRVTGPHLHFEVLEAGQPIDPDGLVSQAFRH